jgi:DNA-binding transcriptional ArsR family regulator
MIKKEHFAQDEKQIAELARTLSHPARIAILKFLATSISCISGDISDEIPLSRTTVSQHLQALKKAGLITGEIEGVKVNYCLNQGRLKEINKLFGGFFDYLNNCINCC